MLEALTQLDHPPRHNSEPKPLENDACDGDRRARILPKQPTNRAGPEDAENEDDSRPRVDQHSACVAPAGG